MTTSGAATLPVAPVRLREDDTMAVETVGPLTRTDFVRYAGASGDFNPIHHDELLAQNAGMPSVFGMGMLHAGILGTRLARWVGPENIRTYSVRFTGQVWPDDELTFSGRVARIKRDGGDALAHIELGVASQRGEEVLSAQATVLVES